ncbi:hypothetical protein D9M73_236670 [compost metagenome]
MSTMCLSRESMSVFSETERTESGKERGRVDRIIAAFLSGQEGQHNAFLYSRQLFLTIIIVLMQIR